MYAPLLAIECVVRTCKCLVDHLITSLSAFWNRSYSSISKSA